MSGGHKFLYATHSEKYMNILTANSVKISTWSLLLSFNDSQRSCQSFSTSLRNFITNNDVKLGSFAFNRLVHSSEAGAVPHAMAADVSKCKRRASNTATLRMPFLSSTMVGTVNVQDFFSLISVNFTGPAQRSRNGIPDVHACV